MIIYDYDDILHIIYMFITVIIDGSLEVKLPMEKQRWEESEKRKEERRRRRSEKRKSQRKEDAGGEKVE